MAKDARLPMRVPQALKEEFEWAAEQDGCKGVSTWLRQLGEERCEELRTHQATEGMTLADASRMQAARNDAQRQIIEATLPAGPAAAFVPGFGLDEED